MTTLVLGASGATGRLLVEQLLKRGQKVRIIIRSPYKLPEFFQNNDNLSVIPASVLDLSDVEMTHHVNGCKAMASCLGHNLSVKGIYGKPRRLVTEAVRRLCGAIKETRPEEPVKFVLMNTTGNSNRDVSEPISFAEKSVVGLLRLLLSPHVDNEEAADYLRTRIGQNRNKNRPNADDISGNEDTDKIDHTKRSDRRQEAAGRGCNVIRLWR